MELHTKITGCEGEHSKEGSAKTFATPLFTEVFATPPPCSYVCHGKWSQTQAWPLSLRNYQIMTNFELKLIFNKSKTTGDHWTISICARLLLFVSHFCEGLMNRQAPYTIYSQPILVTQCNYLANNMQVVYNFFGIRVCEIRRTSRTCPAKFGNVRRRAIVKSNQMSGENLEMSSEKLEMSGEAQNNFTYSAVYLRIGVFMHISALTHLTKGWACWKCSASHPPGQIFIFVDIKHSKQKICSNLVKWVFRMGHGSSVS